MPQVLSEIPENGYSYEDEQPISVRMDGDPYEEKRTKLAPISRRRYTIQLPRTNADRQAADAFLVEARALQYESFYFEDPRDDGLTDAALEPAVGDASTVTFSLPTGASDTNRRFYPIDDADLTVEVNGSPVTVSSVDTDARTVTLASPPGVGLSVTITSSVYRLCRLDGLGWQQQHANYFIGNVGMVEIISE